MGCNTRNEDTGANEDERDVKNLFDRLRSFFLVPEDVTFECFVEDDKDLSPTSGVSEGEIFEMFKSCNGNKDKELEDLNLDRAMPTSKGAMQTYHTIPYFLQT
ncbi:hypothetical protein HZS_2258 [Henneguya salminicola]|nr:hypothetical protein HZS_2258 [Henneguya salminicola]